MKVRRSEAELEQPVMTGARQDLPLIDGDRPAQHSRTVGSGGIGSVEPAHDARHVRLRAGDPVILGGDLRIGVVG
jgi:hypothetical protein